MLFPLKTFDQLKGILTTQKGFFFKPADVLFSPDFLFLCFMSCDHWNATLLNPPKSLLFFFFSHFTCIDQTRDGVRVNAAWSLKHTNLESRSFHREIWNDDIINKNWSTSEYSDQTIVVIIIIMKHYFIYFVFLMFLITD